MTALEEFVSAVLGGDVARTRALLADPGVKARVNDSLPGFHFDGTALLAAAHQNNAPLIDLLLAHGADINQKSRWWAGGFGVLDRDDADVAFLTARGARVDAYAAARHGMLDTLRDLIARNPALVRERFGDGDTPLHVAKTVAIASFLLDHGAAIDMPDVDHEGTPAQHAVRDRQDVTRFLLSRGAQPDLLMAAALGDDALALRLLDEDAGRIRTAVTPEFFPMTNPRAGGHIYIWRLAANATAHMVARFFAHEQLYRTLMQRTPPGLRFAVAARLHDRAEIERGLAAIPGLVAELAPGDARLLVDAATDGDAVAVATLLEAGFPVSARGQEDGTALHWAAFHGNVALVRLLLSHGADPAAVESSYGGTPLGWAEYGAGNGWRPGRGDYPAVIALLKRAVGG
jgi:ankyrin repeat protein